MDILKHMVAAGLWVGLISLVSATVLYFIEFWG
jgi:hypothetical protein